MGFDIECIINIQTYPGEYFCPVCRTLVYPNEAFQSQCTHLYCKPCLAHIANGSKACPFDGYLVTESNSKPLIDSDRILAEKIGDVKVHCLFLRSGCTWEGTLSDCTSHCSECSFGSSAVICNRCGIQIVHRQVHDHAQGCMGQGVYEAKQATEGVPGATSSSTALSTTTATVNLTTAQSEQPPSQPQNSQNVAVQQPGQNPNQQPVANPQAVSVQATEQWYQQQYQHYYQQYAGYDLYQQPNQRCYSLQQYQQHPLHVNGQPQSHAYNLPSAQPHPQPQPQPQLQPVPQPQPQLQLQSHSQPQPQVESYPVPQTQQQSQLQPPVQGQAQSQPPMLSQIQMQVQVPSQGQPQLHAPNQNFPFNYQVNPQPPPPHLMRTRAQFPPLSPHSQPNQFPLSVQAVSMQPAAQHPQLPPYFQRPSQIHHSHASQTHSQPQNQTSNQSHLQIQPQASQYQNQYPQVRPPPLNQPTIPAAQPQPPHPAASSVAPHPPASSFTGHHSYQQPQPAHQMHSGELDQTTVNLRTTSGFHPVKLHGQVPRQPAVTRPPLSHGSFPPQLPSTFLLPQSQVSGAPLVHQQFFTHAQPSNHLPQHGNVLQPVQQAVPQQIAQQQPSVIPVKTQFQ